MKSGLKCAMSETSLWQVLPIIRHGKNPSRDVLLIDGLIKTNIISCQELLNKSEDTLKKKHYFSECECSISKQKLDRYRIY